MCYKKLGTATIILFLLAIPLYGQEVVVTLLPYDGTNATFVNAQIVADTVAAGGMSSDRVYEFQRDQYYYANAIFTVPNGKTLRLRAATGSGTKPIIYLWETGTGTSPTRPPGYFVVLNGGNIEVKDICIAGYYEWEPDRLSGVQGALIRNTAAGSSIVLEGVIFSNTNGNHVRTEQNVAKVKITNSIFANMGALTTSNLGAGKGIDLRDVRVDSFIMVNNTFVNYQDRAIRHYTTDATKGVIDYALIDHNTFVNGMGYHGLFSLGNVGSEITINNNLFVDAFALGEDSTDATRAAEWANTGEKYPNGNNRITWIFSTPNDLTQWNIENNYFTISDSGWAFLNDFGFGPASPLSYHINSKLGADSVDAFTQGDLSLANIPRLMTNMMRWYESPTGGNKTKNTPSDKFVVARDDFDRRMLEFYRDSLDASYSTASVAYIGAEKGFPIGDLNWFPDMKALWEQGQAIPPETPQLVSPSDNATDQPWSLTLSWNPAARATTYQVQVATDLQFTALVLDDATINGTSVDLTSLAPNTKFYWQVRAINDGGPSVWSTVWSFTTIIAAPLAPALVSPPNEAANQPTSLILNWAAAAGAQSYALQVATVSDFATTLINETDITNNSFALGDLVNSITYFWRVNATNVSGTSDWSEVWHFTTIVTLPTQVVQTTPQDKAVIEVDSLTFAWQQGSPEVSKYWFELAQDSLMTNPVIDSTLAADKLSKTVHALVNNQSYWWRVKAKNAAGWGPFSEQRKFQVKIQTGIPGNEKIVEEFRLSQNYPNPFNPTTKITFSLKKAGKTTLVVYNMLGEKVSTLVDEKLSQGNYEVDFNASALPSGMYFYQLNSSEFSSLKKMLLMK
jgi:hypothetical protein